MLWNYDVCAQYPGVVPYGSTVKLACVAEMPHRRYLVVQLERASGYLNFCDIDVNVYCKLVVGLLTFYPQSNMQKSEIIRFWS